LQKGEELSSTISPPEPSGTYFTIYDIPNFTAEGPSECFVPNADWTCTVQFVGFTQNFLINVPDNGSLVNVSFFYVGESPLIGTGQTIGEFGFYTTGSAMGNGYFSSQDLDTATGGMNVEAGTMLIPTGE